MSMSVTPSSVGRIVMEMSNRVMFRITTGSAESLVLPIGGNPDCCSGPVGSIDGDRPRDEVRQSG